VSYQDRAERAKWKKYFDEHVAGHARAERSKTYHKIVAEHTHVVREYLDVVKDHTRILELAIEAMRRNCFSPEAIRFIRYRHTRLRQRMTELEQCPQMEVKGE